MTERPDISALVVNWNGGELVLKAIDALKASAQRISLEIIVCDNGSVDGSADAIARRFPEAMLIRAGRDLHFVGATNLQLPHARGRYILLLNPDAIPEGTAIRTLYEYMEAQPEVGICGPRLQLPDGRMDLACRRQFKMLETYFIKVLLLDRFFPHHPRFGRYNLLYADPNELMQVDAVSGACMLIRDEALDRIGRRMDTRFYMTCEDEDWCCAVRNAGWQVIYNPAALVWHHKGSATTNHPSRMERLKTAYHKHRSMWRFHCKHLGPRYSRLTNAFVFASIALLGALAAMSVLLRAPRHA